MGFTRRVVLPVMLLVLVGLGEMNCALDDLECPLDCECHYFRINWVTDCSESNLTAIPYDWLSSNVYVLNMNGNKIATLDVFPDDIKLRSLELADNELVTLEKDNFRSLGFLLDADFSGNKITTIDPESFKDSPGLLSIDLQNNPLLPIDSGPFLISRSLMNLDLSSCRLSYISKQFFQNTTALRKLDLSSNPLDSIDSGVFDNVTSLEVLKLNHCNLTHLADDAFQHLTNLKRLELVDNNLTSVDWSQVLANLVRLELLDLRHSFVENLPEDVFSNNLWLRNLILADNALRDLDVATTLGHNLKQLDTLDLTNCQLQGPLSDAFGNATKLRTLILSGNPMSASDLAVALHPLLKLQKLSLRKCGLTRLPGNTFHRFDHLQELDISGNPLNDAFTGLLAPLDTLEHLDMSYSNLSQIARNTFSKMNHLRRLILSGNHLTYLEAGLFQNLTHLVTLELNDCGLTNIPDATIFFNRSFTDLREIKLSGNPLNIDTNKPLFPKQLSKLEVVDLSYCNLSDLSELSFQTTPNVKTLKLTGNLFGAGKAKENGLVFLHTLYQLESLDLSNNRMKALSPEAFHFNRYISSLNLIGNPWKCTCDVFDLWTWAAEIHQETRVLTGSTTLPENQIIANRGIGPVGKRKRVLMCNYDSVDDFPKDRRYLKRIKDSTTNRTWAKYVREASCEVRTFVAEPTAEEKVAFRQLAIASISSYKHFYLSESPPRWLVTVVAIAVFYGLCIIVAVVYVQTAKKLKQSRIEFEEKARKEKEIYEHEARLELVRYLQHPRAGRISDFNH